MHSLRTTHSLPALLLLLLLAGASGTDPELLLASAPETDPELLLAVASELGVAVL